MEVALRYELTIAIPKLAGQIYPTNAPEDSTKPYLVYTRYGTNRVKDLDGYTNKQDLSYVFSIMASRYEEVKSLADSVEELLLSLSKRSIGENQSIFVEDLDINKIGESYEFQLKLNREIIDFTIYFKEEKII